MQGHFREEFFRVRELQRHLRQCTKIEEASNFTLKEHLKTTYGVNRRSILTDVPNFDVCQQIPPDIMHILLEGESLKILCS